MIKKRLFLMWIIFILLFASFGVLTFPTNSETTEEISIYNKNLEEDYDQVNPFEKPHSWTEDHGVTFKESISRNTSVDMDERGRFDVVWEDNRTDDFNIFYVKLCETDGEKLINDFRITDNENPSLDPKVFSLQEEYVVIIWQEYDGEDWSFYFSKIEYSDREVRNIIERRKITSLGNNGPVNYTFEQDESDESVFHLVYENKEIGDLYYKQINDVGQILVEERLTATEKNSYSPKIEITKDNEMHLFWLEPIEKVNGVLYDGIFYGKIEDLDFPEEIPFDQNDSRRITVVKMLERYEITLDEEDNIHMIFDDDRYDQYKKDIIYRKMYSDGTTSIDDRLITPREDMNNSFRPSIATAVDGNISLVWADSRDYEAIGEETKNLTEKPHDIYFQKLDTEGNELRPAQRVTGVKSVALDPIIINDEKNNHHIFWEDTRREYMDIFYQRTHKPSLSIEEMRVNPEKPVYNSTVDVEIDLKNEGGSSIDTIGTLYLQRGHQDRCKLHNEEILLERNFSIKEGSRKTLELNFTALSAGHQNLIFKANEDRDVLEENYDRNCAFENITVLPDLEVELHEFERVVDAGQKTNFTYELNNLVDIEQNITVDLEAPSGVEIKDHSLETREMHIFSFENGDYQEHLEEKNETKLKEIFVKENYPLDDFEIVAEEDKEDKWSIISEGVEKYSIIKENEKLNVYKEIVRLGPEESQNHRFEVVPDEKLRAEEYKINMNVESIDIKRLASDEQDLESHFEREFILQINPFYDLSFEIREDNYDRREDGVYIIEDLEDLNYMVQMKIENRGNVEHNISIEDNRNETEVHWGLFTGTTSIEPFETGFSFLFRTFDEDFIEAVETTTVDEDFTEIFEEELRSISNIPDDYEIGDDVEFYERDGEIFLKENGKEYLLKVREQEIEVYTHPTLDLTNLEGIEEDFELNVTAESWDEIDLEETLTVRVKGEEPVSFWRRIPWMWIILIPVIVFIGLIVVGRIYYTFIA